MPLVKKLLLVGGVVAGLLFAFTPRVSLRPCSGAVAVFLLLTTYSVQGAMRDYARSLAEGTGVLDDPTWVDDRARVHGVGVLYGHASDTFQEAVALCKTEFWNRRLKRVYTFGPAEPLGSLKRP